MEISCSLNGVPFDLEKKLNKQLIADAAILVIVHAVQDVRDPATGEPVKITLTPTDTGINICISGSQTSVDVVNGRLSA